jgi:hypothetical protein
VKLLDPVFLGAAPGPPRSARVNIGLTRPVLGLIRNRKERRREANF